MTDISERSKTISILLGIFLSPLAYIYLAKGKWAFLNIITINYFLLGFVIVPIHTTHMINAEKARKRKDREARESGELVVRAKGRNAVVEVYPDRVKIRREGFLAKITHGLKGEKEIWLENITGIQFKEATNLTAGYIQLSQSGYSESKGGLRDSVTDENSVNFVKDQQPEFERVRRKVRELKKETPAREADSRSPIQELKKKLVDGEIGEEEYKRKKNLLEN